jgi:predicted AAA+ superfamily ATPase
MAINLLNLKPHKVSRDLSGYITFIYGPPKVGKTTLET